MIRDLSGRLSRHKVDGACGPLTGGAFTALLVAKELRTEFYYSEQVAGDTSDELLSVRYRLPTALREKVGGKRVAIVNDVTSAGSAVRGTFADLKACHAQVIVIGSLLVLGSAINSFATGNGIAVETLAVADQHLWEPQACPLCQSGEPLKIPSYGPAVAAG